MSPAGSFYFKSGTVTALAIGDACVSRKTQQTLRIQEAQVLAPFESLITPLPRAAAVLCQRLHAFPSFEPYATKHHQSSSGQHGPIIIRGQRPLRERNGNIGES